jgi:predicted transcriptional regulator
MLRQTGALQMAKDKDDKGKTRDKSKGEKLDTILEKLSRIESSIRKLSRQQDGASAETNKVLSALKTLQSRVTNKETNITKPTALRSVVPTKQASGASD